MFDRTYYATHPDMMECVSNDELRDRYLIQDLFRPGECVLNYTHAERFVIGGVAVAGAAVKLPDQSEPASAAGHPFLERRELAVVNVGKASGTVTVDGETFTLGNKDCLYVTMGAKDVQFGWRGRTFLSGVLSGPQGVHHAAHLGRAGHCSRTRQPGGVERAHDLSDGHPRHLRQRAAGDGPDRPQAGSVWNTMPPHIHERRSEIYFYFELDDLEKDRVFHYMGEGEATRHIVMANEEAVISPPWSIHMGSGTKAYAFIWAMAGENQDYTDMSVLDICQLA